MASIQLKTSLPGPKSLAALERRKNALPAGLAKSTDIAVEKAEERKLRERLSEFIHTEELLFADQDDVDAPIIGSDEDVVRVGIFQFEQSVLASACNYEIHGCSPFV